jgi:hypothetical protein
MAKMTRALESGETAGGAAVFVVERAESWVVEASLDWVFEVIEHDRADELLDADFTYLGRREGEGE